tara:strand:+ start:313 stop:1146 length:834 start_codon:yes stop_codon:yes gene_type:complete
MQPAADEFDRDFQTALAKVSARGHEPSEDEKVTVVSRMIDSLDELMAIARSTFAEAAIEDDERQAAEARRCRTYRDVWSPPVEGYLGKVTDGRWYQILHATLKHHREGINMRQFNGDWQLSRVKVGTVWKRYERKKGTKRDDAGELQTIKIVRNLQHFVFFMEWVDLSGNADITYNSADGTPQEALPDNLSPALMNLLQEVTKPAKEPARLEEENKDLRSELGDLRAQLAELTALVQAAQKPAEAPVEAPAELSEESIEQAVLAPVEPKPRRRRRKT